MARTMGFTGTQFTSGFLPEIRAALDTVPRFDRYVTGACSGFDTLSGAYMAYRYPSSEHVVYVPANDYKVVRWWQSGDYPHVEAIEMPEGTTFKDRNQRLVNESDEFYYCALYPEDHGHSRRSGTWQTIRMARRKGIPVTGIILNP